MAAGPTASDRLAPLRCFAARDLERFHGLAPGTRLDDVALAFNLDRSWRGQEPLGEGGHAREWFRAASDQFPDGLRVFAQEEDALLIDARMVGADMDVSPALSALGPPEAKLPAFLGTLQIAESERVYASRGLTIFVNPPNGALLRLAAYAPTSVSDYRERLRLDLKTRRFPSARKEEP